MVEEYNCNANNTLRTGVLFPTGLKVIGVNEKYRRKTISCSANAVTVSAVGE